MIQGDTDHSIKKKNDGDKTPLTLHPLQFDEALRAAFAAGRMPKRPKVSKNPK
jgi:hypothetical protein